METNLYLFSKNKISVTGQIYVKLGKTNFNNFIFLFVFFEEEHCVTLKSLRQLRNYFSISELLPRMSTNSKKIHAKDEWHQKVKSATVNRGPKPIVLSSQRYNKIVNNASTSERLKAIADAEEDQKNKEQLKKGNEELVAQFKGNMQRTQEQKLQQLKEHMDQKIKQGMLQK